MHMGSKSRSDSKKQNLEYEHVRARIWQDHVKRARKLFENVDEEKRRRREQRGKGAKGKPSLELESVMFDSVDLSMSEGKDRKPQLLTSVNARKLGLAKADEFTGTEAIALKKLLRTLRTKTWDPQLYFHIRFFSIRHQLHKISAERKALIREQWRYVLKTFLILDVIEEVLAERSYQKSRKCITCFDMIDSSMAPVLWGEGYCLQFDKFAYKVHANTMISIDARCVLRYKLPKDRTVDEIKQNYADFLEPFHFVDSFNKVVLSLQYVNAFAKLPTAKQHRLAQEAYYLRVGSQRVILQQGHIPQNYYFILLGQAIAKRFLPISGKTETTAILKKGDGFGSVAIFNRCRRQVTVVSQTPLHLLVIPKEVFEEEFIKDVPDPYTETILFLSKMWFMESWPIAYLVKCPHQCEVKQFRRTEIIEANASTSKWIYVVKSGTVRVYQRVFEPPKELQLKKKSTIDSFNPMHRSSLQDNPIRLIVHRCSSVKQVSFSDFSESSGKLTQTLSAETIASSKTVQPQENDRWNFSPRAKRCPYKLFEILRHLDVFGLEDLCLQPKHPPPQRRLLLISNDAECVMLSKNFYLGLAGQQLKQKVYERLTAKKLTYTQVTSADCSLIEKGGIQKDPDALLDPVQPEFCVHC